MFSGFKTNLLDRMTCFFSPSLPYAHFCLSVFAKELCTFAFVLAMHSNTLPCVHVCMFMSECVCTSLSSGVGVFEAGRAHRSGREGGSLQLSLQLSTGCEGHWCDSTNYRGRKPVLQTFTAAAQAGSAGLNPSSTSHFTPLIPLGKDCISRVSCQNEILSTESQAKRNTTLTNRMWKPDMLGNSRATSVVK